MTERQRCAARREARAFYNGQYDIDANDITFDYEPRVEEAEDGYAWVQAWVRVMVDEEVPA